MADRILNTRYSVGYVSLYDAAEVGLPVAFLLNRRGQAVLPVTETIQRAMNNSSDSIDFSLINSAQSQAYPIASFVYAIVNVSVRGVACDSVVELYRFMQWLLKSPAAVSKTSSLSMVPLTTSVIASIQRQVLDNVKCQNLKVKMLVEEQIWQELESLKTWKVPVAVASVVAVVLLAGLASFSGFQRYQYHKEATRKKWKIDFFEFDFKPKHEHTVVKKGEGVIESGVFGEGGLGEGLLGKGVLRKGVLEEGVLGEGALGGHEKSREEMEVWKAIFTLDRHLQKGSLSGKEVRLLEVEMDFHKIKATTTERLNGLVELSHKNLASFLGISTSPTSQHFYVEEACSKGCVTHLLCHQHLSIGISGRYSLARELCSALLFLHSHKLPMTALHIQQCLLDSRWTPKLSHWSLSPLHLLLTHKPPKHSQVATAGWSFLESVRYNNDCDLESYFKLFLAPELLDSSFSSSSFSSSLSEKADVFSFGVVLCAIFCIGRPFNEATGGRNSQTICSNLHLFRTHGMPDKAFNLVSVCCSGKPEDRPSLEHVHAALKSADPLSHLSVIDHVIRLYESE